MKREEFDCDCCGIEIAACVHVSIPISIPTYAIRDVMGECRRDGDRNYDLCTNCAEKLLPCLLQGINYEFGKRICEAITHDRLSTLATGKINT